MLFLLLEQPFTPCEAAGALRRDDDENLSRLKPLLHGVVFLLLERPFTPCEAAGALRRDAYEKPIAAKAAPTITPYSSLAANR